MRPIRLVAQGLTAYHHAVEIDFTELDLFAVTGPTGAGKSSLVDAITYALFGQVPRVGKTFHPRPSAISANLRECFSG